MIRYQTADLWENTADFMAAMAFMKLGRAEGMIPADRPDLGGDEDAIFALSDHEKIGCAVFYQPDPLELIWLDILYVAPAWRRIGIGSTLFSNVRAIAAERGLRAVQFGTMAHNEAMLALGRKMGFAQTAITLNHPIGQREATA